MSDQVLVALLGMAGVLLAAVIANLDKICKIFRGQSGKRNGKVDPPKNKRYLILASGLLLIAVVVFIFVATPSDTATVDLNADDLRTEKGGPVDRSNAPYTIKVKGTVRNAKTAFTYLIVDNGNGQYIQPVSSTLGPAVDGPFTGNCYLGVKDDAKSLDKTYTVFAVVTSRQYNEYNLLNQTTILAKSNEVPVTRRCQADEPCAASAVEK